jgi:hypothetical protein
VGATFEPRIETGPGPRASEFSTRATSSRSSEELRCASLSSPSPAICHRLGYRMAHRCATREASDTILSSGWSSEGYSAIDSRLRGVGYLLAEEGIPRRMRTAHLGDSAIEEVIAEAMRREYGS